MIRTLRDYVYNGMGTVVVNQRLASTGIWAGGVPWFSLGSYHISSGTLVAELTDQADGFVVADAIYVRRLVGT